MKIMIYMIMICLITLGFSGMAQAGTIEVAAGTGEIDLDGAGAMSPISVSYNGVVSYSSDAGAGGYPTTDAAEGDQCAVNTTSSKGTVGVSLEFLVRASEGSGDNSLYQNLVEIVGILTRADGANPDAEGSTWFVRGE